MSEFPARGELLPDVSLTLTDGKTIRLTDYKNRLNVVLVVAESADDHLLDQVSRRSAELRDENAEVIAVLKDTQAGAVLDKRRRGWLFPVAADPEGTLVRRLGAIDTRGAVRTAVYVADSWGEIFLACRAAEGSACPDGDEILRELRFINIQCPECFPSEWRG